MPPRLVFIHGWGFDASFWDPLAARLAQFPQTRVDLGFFGPERGIEDSASSILVGHSLGFLHGINARRDWRGWIAINGFARFLSAEGKPGCATPAALRDMRARLQAGPGKTLRDFHRSIGSRAPAGEPDPARLRAGLDELRDIAIEDALTILSAPGLALVGEKDPLVPPAVSGRFNQWVKSGDLLIRGGGNHIIPWSESKWCAESIIDFLTAHF